MALVIDYSDVPDRSDPVPEGEHEAAIVEAREVVSSKKQTPGIEFTWRIGSQELKDTCWVSPAAMWRFKMYDSGLGLKREGAFTFRREDYIGRKARVEVMHKSSPCGQYTDVEVERVHRIDPADQAEDDIPF